MRPVLAAVFGFLAFTPGLAQAQDAESAAKLQSQLRNWIASWGGPAANPDDVPLRVTAQDDKYRLSLPLPNVQPPNELSATLRPLDGGRWAVDSDQASITTGTVTVPTPPNAPVPGPMHYAFSLGSERTRAEIDPAFATPSTLSFAAHDLNVALQHADMRQEQHLDSYTLDGRLVPTGDGRLDLTSSARTDGWHIVTQSPKAERITLTVAHAHSDGKLTGISQEATAALVNAFAGLAHLLPDQPKTADALPPAQKQALHQALRGVVEALRGSMTGFESRGAMENIAGEVDGAGPFTIRRIAVATQGAAPNDLLHASFSLSIDGVAVPTLPPDIAEWVPSHVALQPSVSGISVTELTRLALEATAESANPDQLLAAAQALWTDPAAQIGIDSLSIVLGPAHLEGHGVVHFTAPEHPVLQARVTASGLDALLAKANGKPEAQQAIPIIMMLKGMARPEGSQLVWDLVLSPDEAKVNGIDLKHLGGGGAGGPPRRHP